VPRLIELEADGITAVAALHEDLAPKTVDRLWNALPVEQKLRHVRWGGNAAYVLVPELEDPSFPVENQVSFYVPGTIGYRPEHGELAFSYGQAQARSLAGNGWATHFAPLKGDTTEFLKVLQRTQREGAKRLVIRRKDG
jgi:hypothetical protein